MKLAQLWSLVLAKQEGLNLLEKEGHLHNHQQRGDGWTQPLTARLRGGARFKKREDVMSCPW